MNSARWIRLFDKCCVAPLLAVAVCLRGRGPGARPVPAGGEWVALKFAGMGDAVLMLPLLDALRARGRVTVITTSRCAAIFHAPGVADRVIVVGRGRLLTQLGQAWAALRAAAAVADFEQHVYWTSLAGMVAPRTAIRYGLRTRGRLRPLAYDVLVDPGAAPRHMKAIFDDLARAAGAAPAIPLRPLPVEDAARARVASWLAERGLRPGAYRVLAPGSGPSAAFRRMSAAQWAELTDALADAPWVLAGTRVDAGLLDEIQARARLPLHSSVGFSLAELACLCAQARAVVATDSGPMHIAAAAGVPVVGVFGPDADRYRPWSPRGRSVWLGLPCSPCNNCFVYREARCSNPDRYACIRRIEPAAVARAVADAESIAAASVAGA